MRLSDASRVMGDPGQVLLECARSRGARGSWRARPPALPSLPLAPPHSACCSVAARLRAHYTAPAVPAAPPGDAPPSPPRGRRDRARPLGPSRAHRPSPARPFRPPDALTAAPPLALARTPRGRPRRSSPLASYIPRTFRTGAPRVRPRARASGGLPRSPVGSVLGSRPARASAADRLPAGSPLAAAARHPRASPCVCHTPGAHGGTTLLEKMSAKEHVLQQRALFVFMVRPWC